MHSIDVVAVGKLKESWWREATDEYVRRLAPYAKVGMIEIVPSPITPSVTPDRSMTDEGGRLLRKLDDAAFVVVMDRTGKRFSSEDLAERIATEGERGRKLQFVIGGAAGLSKAVRERADLAISLSDMTFPHEMARVVLLEQLYRAETISAGKKYHY